MSGEYHYYALTFGNTTKDNPAGLARQKDGSFEVFRAGKWIPNQELVAIFFGEYNDYEDITEEEANQIMKQ